MGGSDDEVKEERKVSKILCPRTEMKPLSFFQRNTTAGTGIEIPQES